MKCKFCNSQLDNPVFDLGNTAVSNDLIIKDRLDYPEKTYPLMLYVCPQCLLVQTREYKGGYEIFSDSYVYFSSCSSYWLKHAAEYCKHIIKTLNLDHDSFVLEVASNDGYLLTNFIEQNIPCLGIEPTRNTALEAIKKGVPTYIEFFNTQVASKLAESGKKADLVIANNVMAHVPDINDFVASFKTVLRTSGTITVEFPHVLRMVEDNEFDTIYHEHYFYFSILSLINIFQKHNLSIYDLDELTTHGGSIRIYVTHSDNDLDQNSNKENVNRVLAEELGYGLDSIKYYESLKHSAISIKLNSLQYLITKKLDGNTIIAFGAAAKGNTFLNYCGIKSDIIEAVVDETPSKIEKYMPQSKIPIVPFSFIIDLKPDIIVILPWNHREEILKKLEFTKKWGCEIVVFIPQLEKLQ